jgi:hypothetical protein
MRAVLSIVASTQSVVEGVLEIFHVSRPVVGQRRVFKAAMLPQGSNIASACEKPGSIDEILTWRGFAADQPRSRRFRPSACNELFHPCNGRCLRDEAEQAALIQAST